MTEEKKSVGGSDAFSLFPDLMKNISKESKQTPGAPAAQGISAEEPPPSPLNSGVSLVSPPPPPDISWLFQKQYVEKTRASSSEQTALILMNGKNKADVEKVFREIGYRIESVDSQRTAIEKVKAMDFAAIVVDEGFSGSPFGESLFHTFMKWLPMERRRAIHYSFIGPKAHTLHGLEALCESVNLVVNESDAKHYDIILKKSLLEHNALFQPYMTILADRKKSSVH